MLYRQRKIWLKVYLKRFVAKFSASGSDNENSADAQTLTDTLVDHDDKEMEGGVSDKFWMETYVEELGSNGPSPLMDLGHKL
jgi:hypothetical protein